MNVKELKSRLDRAVEEAQIIPLNFWWAVTQVAVELKATGEHRAADELKAALVHFKLPAVLHKLLHEGYYHPACAEDLKIRAQYELQLTQLTHEVQKMHEELHTLAGLECRYTVWEVIQDIPNRGEIIFARIEPFKKFLKAFNSPKPEERIFQKLYCGLRTGDQTNLSRLAYWFCFLSDNRVPDCDRKAAADLFTSKQAEFVRTAILNNCYPQAVYDQCKRLVGKLVDYNERLAKKWYNMVCFAAQIKPGDLYYFAAITEDDRPICATWEGGAIDQHRFTKGLCFFRDETAVRWAKGMI